MQKKIILADDNRTFLMYVGLLLSGYGSETKFSGSLGGGFRFPLGEHFGATLGVRGYLTAVNSDTEFFCSGSGSVNCLFETSGSTFFQGEALLGFTAVF